MNTETQKIKNCLPTSSIAAAFTLVALCGRFFSFGLQQNTKEERKVTRTTYILHIRTIHDAE